MLWGKRIDADKSSRKYRGKSYILTCRNCDQHVIPAKAEAVISGVEFEKTKHIFEKDEQIFVYQEGENVKIVSKGLSKENMLRFLRML